MSLLGLLIQSKTEDYVAILDEDGNAVFEGANPVKVSVSREVKYMEHPIESGATVSDHKIVKPVYVSVTMILEPETFRDIYQEIKQGADDSTQYTVQTKTDSFGKMVIESYPSEEDPAMFDTISVVINFREVEIDAAQSQSINQGSVSNKSDSSTVSRGNQSAKDSGSKGSLASRLFGG